jgi:hypothetical protein
VLRQRGAQWKVNAWSGPGQAGGRPGLQAGWKAEESTGAYTRAQAVAKACPARIRAAGRGKVMLPQEQRQRSGKPAAGMPARVAGQGNAQVVGKE